MLTRIIKNPIKAEDATLLSKMGFHTEEVRPGVVRIWRKKRNVPGKWT